MSRTDPTSAGVGNQVVKRIIRGKPAEFRRYNPRPHYKLDPAELERPLGIAQNAAGHDYAYMARDRKIYFSQWRVNAIEAIDARDDLSRSTKRLARALVKKYQPSPDNPVIFPSNARLAELMTKWRPARSLRAAPVSTRTIRFHMRLLEEAGEIVKLTGEQAEPYFKDLILEKKLRHRPRTNVWVMARMTPWYNCSLVEALPVEWDASNDKKRAAL